MIWRLASTAVFTLSIYLAVIIQLFREIDIRCLFKILQVGDNTGRKQIQIEGRYSYTIEMLQHSYKITDMKYYILLYFSTKSMMLG